MQDICVHDTPMTCPVCQTVVSTELYGGLQSVNSVYEYAGRPKAPPHLSLVHKHKEQ